MCIHASIIPAEWCSRCTTEVRLTRGTSVVRRPRSTDAIIHDDATSALFDSMVSRIGACLVFQHPDPDATWGFPVNTESGPTIVSPARYALSRAGRRADSDEVVKCNCGRVGDKHGNGVCVNPRHLITAQR